MYVWELPVRAYHWINAVALVAALRHRLPDRRADPRVLRGRGLSAILVRLGAVHPLLSAFVYVFNFAARLYWGFVGNKYAQLERLLPAQAVAAAGDCRRN